MRSALRVTGTVLAIVVLFVYACVPRHTGHGERATRINCAGNLKQIGLAMRMYSSDNDEHFPPGLYQLVKGNYLTHPKVFLCPEHRPPKGFPKTFEAPADFVCDYWYIPGHTEATAGRETPLVVEKVGNHTHFGNVCFGDGHVKGFAGDEWWKKVDLPRTPPINERLSHR